MSAEAVTEKDLMMLHTFEQFAQSLDTHQKIMEQMSIIIERLANDNKELARNVARLSGIVGKMADTQLLIANNVKYKS